MDLRLQALDAIQEDIKEGKGEREQMTEDLKDLRAEVEGMKAAPVPPNIHQNVRTCG